MDRLLDRAPCGFVAFADDGTVRMVNATLCELLGYGQEEVIGKHIGFLLTAGGRVFYQTHVFPLLKMTGKADEIYLSLNSRNGDEIPVLLNGVRRPGDRETLTECVLVTMRERTRFEDELLRAKKAAQAAYAAREEAIGALAGANAKLEEANAELKAQQEELQLQQARLLDLNDRLRARGDREALLNRIGFALRQSSDPREVLAITVRELCAALQADRCYLSEYDVQQDRSRIGADWRRPGLPSLEGMYRLSEFAVDVRILFGNSGFWRAPDIAAEDSPFPPAARKKLVDLGVRSGVSVALFENGVPVAALTAAMADGPREWTNDEVELIQSVATLTRSVTEDLRLRTRERHIAEVLQDALQPATRDRIPGLAVDAYYQPALDEAEVGGDFYDVFTLGDSCYALVVADLSGKGLNAAAQVATVRHMLRTLLYAPNTTVAEALSSLNEMLTRHSLLRGFATLFIGAYDARQLTLTYVNAGQEPGLILRKTTGQVEELGSTGPVVGAYPGAAFTEQVAHLYPGDVLALFTDGLTEAGSSRRELLEIEGVARIFAASAGAPDATVEEIKEDMMARVEDEVTAAGLRDDVCLLIARVLQESP